MMSILQHARDIWTTVLCYSTVQYIHVNIVCRVHTTPQSQSLSFRRSCRCSICVCHRPRFHTVFPQCCHVLHAVCDRSPWLALEMSPYLLELSKLIAF
jgi:hypothetical protein